MLADHSEYEKIPIWVLQKSGISFPEKKTDMFRRRLSRVVTLRHLSGMKELSECLLGGGDPNLQLDVLQFFQTMSHSEVQQFLIVFKCQLLLIT